MNRRVIACNGGCEAFVDTGTTLIYGPGRLIDNILRLFGTTKVKVHAPGSLAVSTLIKDLQRQTLPLSLTALYFMFCDPYPALYWLHHQWHQLPTASSSLHHQGEGTILRVGSQTGACRNPWAAVGRRVPSSGHVTPLQMLLSLVAGQCLPQKQLLRSKGPSGTLIILK